MHNIKNETLLTPHQEIGLGQSSQINHGCLICQLYSLKGSNPLSDDSVTFSVAFPFLSFFFTMFSIHVSVDKSANKETQYKYWQPKKNLSVGVDANVGEVGLSEAWDVSYFAL